MTSQNANVQFIDVRKPHERPVRSIPGTLHIPLADLPRRLHGLDPDKPVIVHCKSSVRSAMACELLRRLGFREVYNVRGGIDAWD
ncbi:MAG: rhodanese-like domain-containing protein [Bryobacteraceae bacterium]